MKLRDYPLLRGHTRPNRDNPDGEWGIIEVWCPHCRRLHTHGWEKTNTRPEHRVAHCDNNSPFYERGYLIAPFRKEDSGGLIDRRR